MIKKTYNASPLPFQGQKRRFLKPFCDRIADFPNDTIFVDLFGGSGLLSRGAKDVNESFRVIYNDYDHFTERLANIATTNQLLTDIRFSIGEFPIEKILPKDMRASVLKIIESYIEKGLYVDYITLSGSLLFSMNYAVNFSELSKKTLYNNVKKTDYNDADNYLEGLEVVHYDYRELYEQYKDVPNVFFIVDPPYLSTEVSSYESYWNLSQYLEVLPILKDVSFAYFTSAKSTIVELLDYTTKHYDAENPFAAAEKVQICQTLNYSSKYNDIMLFKQRLKSI